MLLNVNQKTDGLLKEIKDYGCAFLSLCHASPLAYSNVESINVMWKLCVKLGYITGDLNGDGDVDDDDESLIVDWNKVAHLVGLSSYNYNNRWTKPTEPIPHGSIILGRYVWKGTHFVLLDKDLNVIFDPTPNSNTVKNGKLMDLRLFI